MYIFLKIPWVNFDKFVGNYKFVLGPTPNVVSLYQ